MRLIFALAALALPFASSAAHGPASTTTTTASPLTPGVTPLGGPGCRRLEVHPADTRSGGKVNRLGELPPGQLVLTVFRQVDGCHEPVIVGQGYGFGAPARERKPVLPPVRARRW